MPPPSPRVGRRSRRRRWARLRISRRDQAGLLEQQLLARGRRLLERARRQGVGRCCRVRADPGAERGRRPARPRPPQARRCVRIVAVHRAPFNSPFGRGGCAGRRRPVPAAAGGGIAPSSPRTRAGVGEGRLEEDERGVGPSATEGEATSHRDRRELDWRTGAVGHGHERGERAGVAGRASADLDERTGDRRAGTAGVDPVDDGGACGTARPRRMRWRRPCSVFQPSGTATDQAAGSESRGGSGAESPGAARQPVAMARVVIAAGRASGSCSQLSFPPASTLRRTRTRVQPALRVSRPRSRTPAGRRSGSSSGRCWRSAHRRSAHTRPGTCRRELLRPRSREHHRARRDVALYSTGSGPVTSMIGTDADSETSARAPLPRRSHALGNDAARADEGAVLDDHRQRLRRLQHPADPHAPRRGARRRRSARRSPRSPTCRPSSAARPRHRCSRTRA